MSDAPVRIAGLYVHPVKSCAGVALDKSLLVETGLELDRAWMVVDEQGRFVTQRELPRMALVRPLRPAMKALELVLQAPGMRALHLEIDSAGARCRVRVWQDEVAACDMGNLAAQWFSEFLGRRLRLVRFEPGQRRLSNSRWTGEIEAENAFSDGYPILVATQAGLDEVNRRLATAGHPLVTMERFRPNLVLDGLDAHGEDHVHELDFDTPDGPVRLRLVKPCSRCSVPDVDPATGSQGHAVSDVLAAYRADARLDGALTFGMNAVIVEGIGRVLGVGMTGGATYRFD